MNQGPLTLGNAMTAVIVASHPELLFTRYDYEITRSRRFDGVVNQQVFAALLHPKLAEGDRTRVNRLLHLLGRCELAHATPAILDRLSFQIPLAPS